MHKIRDITDSDLPVILDIEQKTQISPWNLGMFRDSLHNNTCWLIEDKKQIIGFIIFFLQVKECEILNLAIKPDYQRRGFAERLLTTVLQYANKNRVDAVFLEVRQSNIAAINLYKKAGFKQIGSRKAYYPTKAGKHEDAIILQICF